MAKKPTNKATLLFEAQVKYLSDQLQGDALAAWMEEEIDERMQAAKKLTLDAVVTRKMIKDTARSYAVDLDLGGGLPELVGDIARSIHAHPIHDQTELADLMPDRMFREFLDKILEMKDLRERLIHESMRNPVFSALASDLLYRGIEDYLTRNSLAQGIPGARTALRLGKSVMKRATPNLESSVEAGLRKYIGKSLTGTLAESEQFIVGNFDADRVRDAVLGIWSEVRHLKLSVFKEYVRQNDVEDWVVTLYDYWHLLRKTEIYSALIDTGIDVFFDKYGGSSLFSLLEEIGITRDMMVRDAKRFAPPVLSALRKKKLLEPVIRRNLKPFFDSAEVAKILENP